VAAAAAVLTGLADARITPAAHLQALQSAAQAQGIDLLTFAPGKPAETVPAIEAAKAASAGAINFLALNSFIFKTLEDMDSLYFIRHVAAEGEAVL
jgi:ABC-type sugar transport system substrate-binding protein